MSQKRGTSLRLGILFFILILLAAYYLYLHIRPCCLVTIGENTIVKSNFDFIPEHWKESKLAQLRAQESFAAITADTQFEYFRKLGSWVNKQWVRSIPDPYPLCNALDILAAIRAGKTGGFCGQYAYVLADVLKAAGFFSVRYLELASPTGESHFCIEVWSDQYEKWVLLDPDQALYYELADTQIPAHALEIRTSLLDPSCRVTEKPLDPQTPIQHHVSKEVYANFAVSLRSDLLRHTQPLTIRDRLDMFLFYRDRFTTPGAYASLGGGIPYRHITSRPEDIYYDCNRVMVTYQIDQRRRSVRFQFFTAGSMANFQGFRISLDQGKSWRDSPGHYLLEQSADVRELWVQPVNMAGQPGITTRIYNRFRSLPWPF